MPRKPGFQAAGLPVHIIQRGNNRQACFFADEDYRFFLDHLAKLAKRFRSSLHAYVLMTNHLHLLLSSDLPNGPSLLMKFPGQRYVQYAKSDSWVRVLDNLRDHPNNRPTTIVALQRHIKTLLGKETPEQEVQALRERLQREGVAALNGKKIEYAIPDGTR
jgi:REP element-mobilizing transposase RayT